jgi:hypothetical protein
VHNELRRHGADEGARQYYNVLELVNGFSRGAAAQGGGQNSSFIKRTAKILGRARRSAKVAGYSAGPDCHEGRVAVFVKGPTNDN